MKYVSITLMSLLFIDNANAKQYIYNGNGVSKQYTIEVYDNFKFFAYKYEEI